MNALCFPVQRYRLDFEVTRDIHFPEYAGSALRGLFGHALRRISCVTAAPSCEGCPLLRSCPYSLIFETPPPANASRILTQGSHPYVIEPPANGVQDYAIGSSLSFHVVLLGYALGQLPLIVHAWRMALARRIGSSDGAAQLDQLFLTADDTPLLDPEGRLQAHPQHVELPPAPQKLSVIHLDFLTPFRLTRNGRTLPVDELGASDILASLLRRTHALQALLPAPALELEHQALTAAARRLEYRKQLQERSWNRYSHKQRQRMRIEGWIGSIELRGNPDDLRAWWPLLYLGQWLHIGKMASFGLGQYRLHTSD